MRKAVLALLIIGTCQPAMAQAPWANKLFGGDLVHDFGTVARGVQLKYSFKMTNIYAIPLELTEVHAECGCVTIREVTKVLQPGTTGTLNINMDSRNFGGKKAVKIHVTVGPQWISTAMLTVQYNARTDVVFNPGEIDFGLIHRGQTPTRFIDVEYAGSFPWTVNEIVKNGTAPFDLAREEIHNRGTKGYRITATIKPDAPAGPFKQEVMLKTNDPTTPVLTFNVLGNIQATLSVVPELVELTPAKVGEAETKKIAVRGAKPFRIVGIDGQGDGLTAVAVAPDHQATLQIVEIRFNPSRAGVMKKQLVIRTDLDNEAVTVTVQGNGT